MACRSSTQNRTTATRHTSAGAVACWEMESVGPERLREDWVCCGLQVEHTGLEVEVLQAVLATSDTLTTDPLKAAATCCLNQV